MEMPHIIKYEGNNDTFVWKHPCENFYSSTQLIVHESQEALFFLNGQALDLFGPGRYTLETQNIPLVGSTLKLPAGAHVAFHCEVYFINMTERMTIPWGTDSKVQYIEPTYKFPISLGASGEMLLCVENARKLLIKLVGTEHVLTKKELVSWFRSFIMPKIKSYIAQTIKSNAINIFEIDENLERFSEDMKDHLQEDFYEYGLMLKRFFVTTIVRPDGEEQYEKFKDLHFQQYTDVAAAQLKQKVDIIGQETESQKKVIEAQANAKKRSVEGYTYQQERGYDVIEKAAQNDGAGNLNTLGVGLGMMAGIGGTVSGIVQNAMAPVATTAKTVPPATAVATYCEQCGATLLAGAAFCEECGTPVAEHRPQCKQCGFVFQRAGKFCPNCGTKREEKMA